MILFFNVVEDNRENEQKFDNIYEQYYPYAYKIAYNIVRDTGPMEDIMQNIFLNVWKIIDKMTDEQSTKALIATIARNTAINTGQKISYDNDKTLNIDDDTMYAITPINNVDPLDDIVSEENIQSIYEQIKSMKKIYADVLLLKYKFHFSPEKIAETLQLNIKTVYTRIDRGDKILREKLYSYKGKVK